ncbi:hypothetical protein [Streptomyces sp. NPDC102264]|uniref:hypothetical protein n=1 Tax=Streptomyces sp. NPDC102264 TaxID=3366149 RepID=UPI003806377E
MDADELRAYVLNVMVEWAEGYTFPETGSQQRVRPVAVDSVGHTHALFSVENQETYETQCFRVDVAIVDVP